MKTYFRKYLLEDLKEFYCYVVFTGHYSFNKIITFTIVTSNKKFMVFL